MLLPAMRRNPFVWLFMLFAATFILVGPDFTDYYDYIPMASNPWRIMVEENRQFLYASPLNFILGYLLGLDSKFGFYLLPSIELALMLVAVPYAVSRRIPARDQARFLSLLALTPLWFITVKWIGKTDPVLISCLFLAWAIPGRWRYAFATVMILAHREIGSLMCLSLWLLEGRKDYGLLAALAFANGLHLVYQYGVLDHPPLSRMELMAGKATQFMDAFANVLALYIMSMFSWYWAVLLLNRPSRAELFLFSVAFFLALINEDFTRDFILAALTPILFHLEKLVKKPENDRLESLAFLAPFHFQIAAMGHVHAATNPLIDPSDEFGRDWWSESAKKAP